MKKLLFILILLVSCQVVYAADPEAKPQFTAEECAQLGWLTDKYARYHEEWAYKHDSEAKNVKTGMLYKDEVLDITKEKVIAETIRWHKNDALPPYNEDKYLQASLKAIDVAYDVIDVDDVQHEELGEQAFEKCMKENYPHGDAITSDAVN